MYWREHNKCQYRWLQSYYLNVFWRYIRCTFCRQILHCHLNCFSDLFSGPVWFSKRKENPNPNQKIYIFLFHISAYWVHTDLFTSVKPSFHIEIVKMFEFILTVLEKWILSPSASATKWGWLICTKFRDGSREASSCNIFTTSQTKIALDKQYTLRINIKLKYDTTSLKALLKAYVKYFKYLDNICCALIAETFDFFGSTVLLRVAQIYVILKELKNEAVYCPKKGWGEEEHCSTSKQTKKRTKKGRNGSYRLNQLQNEIKRWVSLSKWG